MSCSQGSHRHGAHQILITRIVHHTLCIYAKEQWDYWWVTTSLVNIKFSQMLGNGVQQCNGNVLGLREKMSIIFVKTLLKSMIFVKIILFSEGHQTKPAWDNVHIPQTNVFNVKQFNQNPSPQKPASFPEFSVSN